jgi:hypothetical protein
MEPEPSQDK